MLQVLGNGNWHGLGQWPHLSNVTVNRARGCTMFICDFMIDDWWWWQQMTWSQGSLRVYPGFPWRFFYWEWMSAHSQRLHRQLSNVWKADWQVILFSWISASRKDWLCMQHPCCFTMLSPCPSTCSPFLGSWSLLSLSALYFSSPFSHNIELEERTLFCFGVFSIRSHVAHVIFKLTV